MLSFNGCTSATGGCANLLCGRAFGATAKSGLICPGFWFNLGHMFDSVKIGEKVDMKRFTQTTQDAIDKAVEAGHLEPVHQMYKKPAMEDLRHDWGVSE